jgi:RNA polymerase sigma-70 factor (ECF subfamily)
MTAANQSRADTELIDVGSIEAMYRDCNARCYQLALHIVRDRDLAHDVVQDVFEALVRQPDRFVPARGTALAWLMTLTHNKAVDLVRWRQRHTRLDFSDDGLTDLPGLGPTPDDVASRAEDRDRVHAALRQLKAAELEVLVLAHFSGYSQPEIARHTGLPLGTVKGRTRSALRWMRTYLAMIEPLDGSVRS